jgi:tetratricopeptide (TPR) repeat protein
MRHLALSYSKAVEIGLPEPPPDSPVWGVIMENGNSDYTSTVVAFGDGGTSLYVSSGFGVIGGGEHENIREANTKFIQTANQSHQHLEPCESYPIPEAGRTHFYVFTDSGMLTAGAPDDDLHDERHPLSSLFIAGHAVLSGLLQLADESEKKEILKGVDAYDHAISCNPSNAKLYYGRGDIYLRVGEYDKAMADYYKAVSLEPQNPEMFIARGCLYVSIGDLTSAVADFDRAIAIKPTDAMAYANRGAAYSKLGDVQRAIADYGSAIQYEPRYANSYANRAYAYYKLGEYEKGMADCDKAITLRPDHANTYCNRGLCRAALGDGEGAAADFRRALELPGPPSVFEEASEGLRALSQNKRR